MTGRALAVLIWLLTLASVGLFFSGWWFPASIAEHGPDYDRQFVLTIIVVGLAFAAAQVGLGYTLWRYRDTGDGTRAVYSHGNNRLEIVWTGITALIFITVALLGQRVWARLHFQPAPADSYRIRVTAQQFQWNFHYAGADGAFGKTKPELIADDSLNFVGLDPSDAASADDTVVGTLAVEVNRPVELLLTSRDVTHSFWVPGLRFKQDAVPGVAIPVHFTPNKVGQYEIACAELCGQQHYKMKALMLVLPSDEHRALAAMPQAQFQLRLAELVKKYPVVSN